MPSHRSSCFAVAAALALSLCSGCDTMYAYHYRGKILERDGRTPAPAVQVAASPVEPFADGSALPGKAATSDSAGVYHGTFLHGFSSPITFRSAPPLTRVFVTVRAGDVSRNIQFELTPEQQARTGWSSRTLELPPINLDR